MGHLARQRGGLLGATDALATAVPDQVWGRGKMLRSDNVPIVLVMMASSMRVEAHSQAEGDSKVYG